MNRLKNGRFASGNTSFHNVRGANGRFVSGAAELAEVLTSKKKKNDPKPAYKPLTRVALIGDVSGSMNSLQRQLRDYISEQAKKAFEVSEPDSVRLSVYRFSYNTTRVIFEATSAPTYVPIENENGMTAFIDAVMTGINDLDKYTEDAKLLIVITDGCENASKFYNAEQLRAAISARISTDKWTFVCLTPETFKYEPAKFGFLDDCVKVWDVSKRGLEEATNVTQKAVGAYFSARAAGQTSVRSFFNADVDGKKASKLKDVSREYDVYTAPTSGQIRELVENATGQPYQVGSTFYKLSKAEVVQPFKSILLRKGNRLYGGPDARAALGLPKHEVRIAPGDTNGYDVFVLSTSVNRNLFGGTEFAVKR